jgi:CubicO group peptidase (beta-lactamase class C family)
MSVATVFDLASLTKVFATTFGVMMLVDRGKIELDAPVFTYLPLFRGVSKDSVTVRHLLTHSAGLYQWKPLYYHGSNSAKVLAYISDLDLRWPVGKERHYSDLGFMLLGYIIEHVSGRPLDQFLEMELYEPLGLQHTGFLPQSRAISGFAATSHGNPFEYKMVADDDFGYECDEQVDDFTGWRYYTLVGEVNDGNAFYANEGVAGHAGLFSNAEDLNVLLRLLLQEGEYQGRRFFNEDVATEFLTVDQFGNGLGWAMSPGIVRVENPPAGSFGHTGFTGTYALAVPEYGLTVILLTNRQNLDVDASGIYNSVNPLRSAVVKTILGALRRPG